jgi:hypothetical protein
VFTKRVVRQRRGFFELVEEYQGGPTVVLADLGAFPDVESAYQSCRSLQNANDRAYQMARFLYQYRNPQILMMEQAEARRVEEQRERQTKRRRAYNKAGKYRRHDLSADHYRTLGLVRGATEEQIRSAFKDKAKTHHPDKGGKQEEFVRIRQAYEALMKDRSTRTRERS